MKIHPNRLYLVLCLGLSTATIATVFTGCAGDRYNRSTGEYIDDNSLRLRASTALGDNPDYKFEGVNLTVFKGVVQLNGFVDLAAQRTRAGEIVTQVSGVRSVENNLAVKKPIAAGTGESTDDKSLTTSVKSVLGNNPDYKFEEVNVAAYEGTVQLSGFVNTADQKAKSGELARAIPEVKGVLNNITVKEGMDGKIVGP